MIWDLSWSTSSLTFLSVSYILSLLSSTCALLTPLILTSGSLLPLAWFILDSLTGSCLITWISFLRSSITRRFKERRSRFLICSPALVDLRVPTVSLEGFLSCFCGIYCFFGWDIICGISTLESEESTLKVYGRTTRWGEGSTLFAGFGCSGFF